MGFPFVLVWAVTWVQQIVKSNFCRIYNSWLLECEAKKQAKIKFHLQIYDAMLGQRPIKYAFQAIIFPRWILCMCFSGMGVNLSLSLSLSLCVSLPTN